MKYLGSMGEWGQMDEWGQACLIDLFTLCPLLSFSQSFSTSLRSSLFSENSSANFIIPLLNAAGSCRNNLAVSWLVKPPTSRAIQAITRFALAFFLPRPRCNATDGGRSKYSQTASITSDHGSATALAGSRSETRSLLVSTNCSSPR